MSALLDGWLWQKEWFWFAGVLHPAAGVLHLVVGVLHLVVGVLNPVVGVLHPAAEDLHFKSLLSVAGLEMEDHFFFIFEIADASGVSHVAKGRVGVLIRALLDSDHTLGFQD